MFTQITLWEQISCPPHGLILCAFRFVYQLPIGLGLLLVSALQILCREHIHEYLVLLSIPLHPSLLTHSESKTAQVGRTTSRGPLLHLVPELFNCDLVPPYIIRVFDAVFC